MALQITIPCAVINGIYDECDRHEHAETGGRILGFYSGTGANLQIEVKALIGPGPNAKRSATSLFQDGEYQERIFRAVEKQYPAIAHLGNWHSHVPNGLACLSNGDRETYQKIVNHPYHAQDFFYALLVTRKTYDPVQRYDVKHYLLFRRKGAIYDVPAKCVAITDSPVLQLR